MSPICKACQGAWPAPEYRLGDCGLTRAYLFDDQYFEGWTVLVLKQHATELFQLSAAERARLMEEVSAVALVLAETYRARKINYELLGNQLPHIHWHVVPRGQDDPAPAEPVWRVPHLPVSLASDALAIQLTTLREALGRTLTGFRVG
ncbi:HIT family protein [Nitrospira sp.]|nr:HIT family protein [Nitrospira sp.]